MEKGEEEKKIEGLSTCILQIWLCTSAFVSASDRHVRSSVSLIPSLDLLQVFTQSVFQEQDRSLPPAPTYQH